MNASQMVRGVAIALALAAGMALTGCAHIVILRDPLSANEHNDLGVAYESSGQLDLAAKEYHKALGLDSHQTRARVNLGNVQAARGEWGDAEKCYRRALRDSSTDYDAMNNLAVALLKQGRSLEEARQLAERAVAAGGERDSVYRATLADIHSAADREARK
jgi:Flp pilus assembly protein TadD